MTAAWLVPVRRRGRELLEDPDVDPAVVRRSLHDVARANAMFGGRRAVLRELPRALAGHRAVTLLDVGAGLGDITAYARALSDRLGIAMSAIALDASEVLAREARVRAGEAVCGDARTLPIATNGVDIATCSQTLHHFVGDDALALIRELNRVARSRVIISDLRRSWIAAVGIWVASFPLGFHPVSRHDGVLSVLRGFTAAELVATVQQAVGQVPTLRRHLGFRLTVSWRPMSS